MAIFMENEIIWSWLLHLIHTNSFRKGMNPSQAIDKIAK